MIGQIELTEAEQGIVRLIVFGHDGIVGLDYEETEANGERMAALMDSLWIRKAIPEPRLRYFFDRAYNVSNSKESLRDLFLRESRTDDVMYRHPHFNKSLRYFVFGADLPNATKEAFLTKFEDSEGDREQMVTFARSQFRELKRTPHPQDYTLPEDFYQLALDCGCSQWDARAVRDAVKKVRL